eukprot:gene1336-2584_t
MEMKDHEKDKPKELRDKALLTQSIFSDRGVVYISMFMTAFSLIMITIMLIVVAFVHSSSGSHPAGWIAVTGAVIVFGSTGIPMKTPILKTIQIDSLIFALYTSIGIVIITMPLLLYMLSINQFQYIPESILGAIDIMLISYFSFNAVQLLGYAIAPAIWAGIGMIVAFLWGIIVFEEHPIELKYAILSMCFLITGVSCISLSSSIQDNDSDISKLINENQNYTEVNNDMLNDEHQTNNTYDMTLANKHGTFTIEGEGEDEGEDDDDKDNNHNEHEITKDIESQNKHNTSYSISLANNNSITTHHSTTLNNITNTNIVIQEHTNNEISEKGNVDNSIKDTDNNNNNNMVSMDNMVSKYFPIQRNEPDVEVEVEMKKSMGIDTDMNINSDSLNNIPDNNNNDNNNGYALCVLTGLLDGSLSVPFKMTSSSKHDSNSNDNDINSNLHATFSYLVSFGISNLFISPFLFLLYCVVVKRGHVPSFHVSVAALPGVLSGILWASANFLSVHATFFLGIKVGFPLTQTCVVVTSLWGLLYFKEINIRNMKFLMLFIPGIVFIVIGAFLLGNFG